MIKSLFYIFCFLSCQITFAQHKLNQDVYDSLWATWNNSTKSDSVRLQAIDIIAWDGYLYTNLDSSIYFAELQYQFAQKKNRKKEMALALNTQGVAFDKKGDYINALIKYKKALSIRRKEGDKQGVAASLNNIGSIYRNQGDYTNALNYFLESLKIKEELEDKKGIANSLLGIGNVFSEQEDHALAREYYEKSLVIRKELGDKKGIANSLISIGNIFWIEKNYTKALTIFNESLTIQKEIGDLAGVANSLNNIGVIHMDMGEYDKAMKFHQESLSLRQQIGDLISTTSSLRNIGSVYLKQGNITKALEFAHESLKIAQQIGAPRQQQDSHGILYDIYKKGRVYDKALTMYEKFITLRDSLMSEENHKEITKLRYQYQYEVKHASDSIKNVELKKILEAENEKQKAIAARRTAEAQILKNQQYALFIGLALVLFFTVFLFNRYRLISKQKSIIETQKEEVEIKNKEISASITYAKRIQEAILPSRFSLAQNLKNGFVFFKPKDIVSGDFYWLEHYNKQNEIGENKNLVFFAAADCTGHGVPGAMVSVVCSNALSKALLEENITNTGQLLDRTRELVIHQFAKSDEEVKDGMDISLCSLSYDENLLQWSGANNPLWIVNPNRTAWPTESIPFQDCEFAREIKANSQPIGNYTQPEPFTTHTIELEKGDSLYILTDGFQDQFGGEKGKKFKSNALKNLLVSLYDLSMDQQKEKIEQTFIAWKGEHEQVDDVCIIGIKI
jgi:tetratricopeptide (TPR) repeat protein